MPGPNYSSLVASNTHKRPPSLAEHEPIRIDVHALERFDIARLLTVIPGSTRRHWMEWTRLLVAQKVLVKRGKGWLGRRAAIEAALVGGK